MLENMREGLTFIKTRRILPDGARRSVAGVWRAHVETRCLESTVARSWKALRRMKNKLVLANTLGIWNEQMIFVEG